MPNFQRGLDIPDQPSSKSSGNGQFSPIVPKLFWQDDKTMKYIRFLDPKNAITASLHDFIPVGTWGSGKTKYAEFISRKDPGIGEGYDDLEDRLENTPRQRMIGVGVELEPIMGTAKNGRQRPESFVVATDTFTRRTDDGEEEVQVPRIGMIIQSKMIFWGWLKSYNENTGDLDEAVFQITRRGKGTETQYDFVAYEDKEVDYGALINLYDNITYLSDADIEITDNPNETANGIARFLLDKYVDEISDMERYQELVSPITALNRRFDGTSGGSGTGGGSEDKSASFTKLRNRVNASNA